MRHMLTLLPITFRYVPLTQEINIKQRQARVAEGACWRCGSTSGHATRDCGEKAVIADDVVVED